MGTGRPRRGPFRLRGPPLSGFGPAGRTIEGSGAGVFPFLPGRRMLSGGKGGTGEATHPGNPRRRWGDLLAQSQGPEDVELVVAVVTLHWHQEQTAEKNASEPFDPADVRFFRPTHRAFHQVVLSCSRGRQGRRPIGATTPPATGRSRWSPDSVKNLATFEISSTEGVCGKLPALGRQGDVG